MPSRRFPPFVAPGGRLRIRLSHPDESARQKQSGMIQPAAKVVFPGFRFGLEEFDSEGIYSV
jgi:hypothetical protein